MRYEYIIIIIIDSCCYCFEQTLVSNYYYENGCCFCIDHHHHQQLTLNTKKKKIYHQIIKQDDNDGDDVVGAQSQRKKKFFLFFYAYHHWNLFFSTNENITTRKNSPSFFLYSTYTHIHTPILVRRIPKSHLYCVLLNLNSILNRFNICLFVSMVRWLDFVGHFVCLFLFCFVFFLLLKSFIVWMAIVWYEERKYVSSWWSWSNQLYSSS